MTDSAQLATELSPGTTNNVYEIGQEITCTIPDRVAAGGMRWKVILDDWETAAFGEFDASTGQRSFSYTPERPGVIRFSVRFAGDSTGPDVSVGALVAPEDIAPSRPTPDDFNAFWDTQLEPLRNADIRPRMQEVHTNYGCSTYAAELDTPTCGTVHAWVHIPRSGKSGPVAVRFHGAGVYGVPIDNGMELVERGFAVVSVNAHPIPNDRPKTFYADLTKGELADYRIHGRESRDEVYFVRMFLRTYAAVELARTVAEWNGRQLLVDCHSQGGGQAIAAAGLHPAVTGLVASCPTHCDHTGYELGRKPGWPGIVEGTGTSPDETHARTAQYIDGVNFAQRITAPALVGCCLLDDICPPGGIIAAYNSLRVPKELYVDPYTAHIYTDRFRTASFRWLDRWLEQK